MPVSDGLGGHLDWAKTRRKGETFINQRLTFQKRCSDQHCGQQVLSLRKVRPGTKSQKIEELEIFYPQEQQVLIFLCFTFITSSEVLRDQCFYCAEISSLDTNVLRWDINNKCDKLRLLLLMSSFLSYKLSQCGEERDTVMLCSDASNQPWR